MNNGRIFKAVSALLCIVLLLSTPFSTALNARADYEPGSEITGDTTEVTSEVTTEEDAEDANDTEDSEEAADSEEAEDSEEAADAEDVEDTEDAEDTEDSEDAENEEDASEETDILYESDEEAEGLCGYIEMPDQEAAESLSGLYEDELLMAASIPASYDSRDYGRITSVKDQNPYGTCWSFALMAALESSLISLGTVEDADLSEMHFIRYYYPDKWVGDPLGGTDPDCVNYYGSSKMDQGGNSGVAYHTLINWLGVTDESYNPYPEDPGTLSLDDGYNHDLIYVQNVYRINKADVSFIKRAIMQYGALAGSMGYFSYFYEPKTAAYYADVNKGNNHAVTFVGWDDNYSKENFKEPGQYYDKDSKEYKQRKRPEKDGAWLVKNSWGTGWGNEGYFWMSYEDCTFDTFTGLVGAVSDDFDHNYQYDGSYLTTQVSSSTSTITAANVFTVKGKEQYLDAVSFDTPIAAADYTVKIYINPTDLNNPESGTPVPEATASGSTSFSGYYTVALSQRIPLIPGDSFAVVLELTKKTGNAMINAERSGTRSDSQGKPYGSYTATALPNQSFVKENGEWYDYGKRNNQNLRIKAFTSDIPEGELINPFTDMEEDNPAWKYDAALYAFNNGYMNGMGRRDGKVIFSPDTLMNRAQFVQVLYSMAGKPETEYAPLFEDVPEGKWFTDSVIWAAKNGIVSGKGAKFDVNGTLSREQMALIYYQFARYNGYDVSVDPKGKTLDDFTDYKKVSTWAKDAVKWAISRGIISGKGNEKDGYRIDPKGSTSRAECAAILKKFNGIYSE